nr:MAG TPA: hypothetical protein [Caudoviricetes sp.]
MARCFSTLWHIALKRSCQFNLLPTPRSVFNFRH